ncbi:hypothetical protein SJAG_06425 [Schizosaccharomyces japonicus yFS275]|uniref:Uncharacterized protein n=1 Tax=Schizosaccharomyces japonicus (strain yFS275 / FY16936) TaxID=402676 RepID=T0RSV4_SCHJY|nr:hypothetical protein SJAG_06425 [Schizosaccharomyces japonicus yFS275]EQC53025.1 hypothetical protein SJAG_06425 [Schizosaccharomyces japonicus yFS275]
MNLRILLLVFGFYLIKGATANTEILTFKGSSIFNRNDENVADCMFNLQKSNQITLNVPMKPMVTQSSSSQTVKICGLRYNSMYTLRSSWPAVYPIHMLLHVKNDNLTLIVEPDFYPSKVFDGSDFKSVPVQLVIDRMLLNALPESLLPFIIALSTLSVMTAVMAFFYLTVVPNLKKTYVHHQS